MCFLLRSRIRSYFLVSNKVNGIYVEFVTRLLFFLFCILFTSRKQFHFYSKNIGMYLKNKEW